MSLAALLQDLQPPPAGGSRLVTPRLPHGRVEVVLTSPHGTPRGAVLVCHPHPLYGGAMSNKVVWAIANQAAKRGFATLKFNFRGVGKSEGLHDDGKGETEDCIALYQAWTAAVGADCPGVLAGFSFGAWVSLRAASVVHPAALLSIAPPFAVTREIYAPPPPPGCPWQVVHSRDDDVVAYADTAAALARYQPPPQLTTVDGCGHFFHGRLEVVTQAFDTLIDATLP